MDISFGGKYRIVENIGSGSFGDIYLAVDIDSGEEVAVKVESARTKHPTLQYEAQIYKKLAGEDGVPHLRWFGVENDYNAMVIDLLGPDLEELFNRCGRKFSLKTVLLLADQLITLLESVHNKYYIHRDIKPDNFVMGAGKRVNQVHIIDFGLAKKYRDPETLLHIPYREEKKFVGTARFASTNTHLGVEQGRRDDMEALAHMLIYFLRGDLPWQGLQAPNKQRKYDLILGKKMTVYSEKLCRKLPREFAILLNYSRSIRFHDAPDYAWLRELFRDLSVSKGFAYDYVFDWSVPTGKAQAEGAQLCKEEMAAKERIDPLAPPAPDPVAPLNDGRDENLPSNAEPPEGPLPTNKDSSNR
ncbi:CK1/CK1 protein kinase [Puccinia triticina 1-1 BBBD Race 1]|uniref:non-specific serine/threonine protein kinase n=1 Tax=Puccinia triticina (isolate 1-1 / race 1 (BBBD)) TaxID=630390 RepID=A0A0C4EUY0_PUCT1|nr:CK1/CK1 protein kinase [Puccinia triticina 1-1 BBBD Race 1]WAR58772.1 hypothetical protein PtB15_10B111 [Puccinia triticina]